jgi:Tfp pilus assembly protein PilN
MINLLSQKAKQELRQEQRLRLLLVFLFMFTVAFVSFALMLGVVKVSIARSLLLQGSKIALFQERFSKDNLVLADIQEFNETTSQISRFLKNSRSISLILESLEEIVPSGIHLTAFDYDPPGVQTQQGETTQVQARISVAGFAKTRETLFAFRENLEKNPLFSGLEFPASNWVLPQDISFSFHISIVP